jgi:hypothetical protein
MTDRAKRLFADIREPIRPRPRHPSPTQNRSIVARFDRLNGTLSSKRALRPSRSWPFLAAHLEDQKLSVERRVIEPKSQI